MTNNDAYRTGVGLVLINKDGLLFLGNRIDVPTSWQLPQGGIDAGETPQQALFRESSEEIGNANFRILAEHPHWLYYDVPEAYLPKIWEGMYRGQKQKWFLCLYLGQDDDININTDHPEFIDWRWATIKDALQVVEPFKRALYEEVLQYFSELINEQCGNPA